MNCNLVILFIHLANFIIEASPFTDTDDGTINTPMACHPQFILLSIQKHLLRATKLSNLKGSYKTLNWQAELIIITYIITAYLFYLVVFLVFIDNILKFFSLYQPP